MLKISIIIPVYNTEKYLKRCIDSAINQTYKNIEIIIVNDYSPGNCDDIVKEYLDNDNRIKYIKLEKNSGTLLARKRGTLEATGDYTTYIDSDDEIDLNTCSIVVDTLNKKEYDIVQVGSKIISKNKEKNNNMDRYLNASQREIKRDNILLLELMEGNVPVNMCTRFFNTSILKKAAYYLPDKHLVIAEDLLQFFTTAYFASSHKFIDKKLYIYHYDNGISSDTDEMTIEKYERLCSNIKDIYSLCYDFLCTMKVEKIYGHSFSKFLYINYLNIKDTAPNTVEHRNILKKYFDEHFISNYKVFTNVRNYYNYNEATYINRELIPYLFSIIKDSRHFTLRLFGIKISFKHDNKNSGIYVITISSILRRIFSIDTDNKGFIINILFLKIIIKKPVEKDDNVFN